MDVNLSITDDKKRTHTSRQKRRIVGAGSWCVNYTVQDAKGMSERSWTKSHPDAHVTNDRAGKQTLGRKLSYENLVYLAKY
jgi:hypothetical protein